MLRIEDLDLPRVRQGATAEMLRDLRWLGLDWDEGPDVGGPLGPYAQSMRNALYEGAFAAFAPRPGLSVLLHAGRAGAHRKRAA